MTKGVFRGPRQFAMLVLTLLAVGLPSASKAQAPHSSSTAAATKADCTALLNADFDRLQDAPTQVTAAKFVESTAGTASYCQVEGYVVPQVGFELRLPANTWNGKFLEVGCGGWCGIVHAERCDSPLRRGYACITTDTG